MANVSLTTEQQIAISTRAVSIALSAGAGCGKTHVLTERFLAHLAPAVDGERTAPLGALVAITFTDAAAREMRSRIRRGCYDRVSAAVNADAQDHWLRLLREMDSARISTIHAFCASLLRAHAAAADLDPTFAVLDQGEADLLQFNAIDDVLRSQLAELEGDTLDLAAAYGLARLKQQIAALLSSRRDSAFQKWLDAPVADLIDTWREYHEKHALALGVRAIAATAPINKLVDLLRNADTQGRKSEFLEARASLLELLPSLQEGAVAAHDLKSIHRHARVHGLCKAADWQPPEVYQSYKNACAELRRLIDSHKPQAFDAEAALETARLGLALLRLTAKVAEEYRVQKSARGALDFDDLLAEAYALISGPNRAELRGQISHDLRLLLVDEFQDTDQLQVDLVKALCGPDFDAGGLFFVGDFKQSIYRFRGAKPKVFRDLRKQIPDAGQLPLTINFRSQPGILEFVNALFGAAFANDGHEYEPLRASRPQATELPVVEFLWTIAENKNNNRLAGSALEARRMEARAIARRLRSMLDQGDARRPIVDKETRQPRALKPGDVAILFRALSDIQVYEEALREYGLDYYLVGGHAFYAQQEIYDVLNLLRAVASTADEVSLAGVLRSPFFSLQDETLFWLVEAAANLNAGLLSDELPAELSPEERAKVAAAAATIRHLRAVKDRLPIAALLGEALDRTGYDAVLLTEFLGPRKLANLHKLIERARVADSGAVDLDGFITQLSQFIAQDPKESPAATLPENADVIRLMTIHHAKGLEFPLVVVADLDRRPILSPPPAALHPELGPLVPPPADDERKKIASGMSLFAAAQRIEELEERKRMLYVAATRAADYLILSSSLAAYDKPQSDWMNLLAERFDLRDGALLGSASGFDAPSILVTTEPCTDYEPKSKSRGPDLLKLLGEAHRMAANGQGRMANAVGPISIDHAARHSFSVSRLNGRLSPVAVFDHSERQPAAFDARGFGTLVHEALARIDFCEPDRDIAAWCEHLAPQHVLVNAKEAGDTARGLIEQFVASPPGRQMTEAAALHREVEFLLAWPPGDSKAATAHIRGYIDCLFQDQDGHWHLADYKTDALAAADVPRVAQRYTMQLYVYAFAAELALGQSPVEIVLHFLRPGTPYVLPWNAAARRRAIEIVNSAMDSVLRGTPDGATLDSDDLVVSETR